MMTVTKRRPAWRLMAAAVALAGLAAVALPLRPAHAQVPYLGVDFGNGFGIGIGAPPSAYGMAPASPLTPLYYPTTPYPYYYRW